MVLPHQAQTILSIEFLSFARWQKKGRGPATLVLRPSQSPLPKRDQTTPIDGAVSSDWERGKLRGFRTPNLP